jgi:hypothetical protein
LIGLILFFVNGDLHAEEISGFGCVDQMTLPVYAGLVWQAQITGTATARILLNSEGSALHVKIDSPHKALTGWVAGTLSKASFLKECKGRTIELIFKYRLEGQKREAPDNQIVVKHPGTVEITAYPPILHPIVN